MSFNGVSEICDALNELLYLHQINIEMMEALGILAKHLNEYARKNNVPFDESTMVVMEKAMTLCDEMTNPPRHICLFNTSKFLHPT